MRQGLAVIGDGLAAACRFVAGACLASMTAIVAYAVGARYLLGSAPAWTEELPRLLLIWGALLGAVIAERQGSHLTAGLFPLLVTNPVVRYTNALLVSLATVLVYALLSYASFLFAMRTLNNSFPALQISVGWMYLAAIVGFGCLAVVAAINLLTRRASS